MIEVGFYTRDGEIRGHYKRQSDNESIQKANTMFKYIYYKQAVKTFP